MIGLDGVKMFMQVKFVESKVLDKVKEVNSPTFDS